VVIWGDFLCVYTVDRRKRRRQFACSDRVSYVVNALHRGYLQHPCGRMLSSGAGFAKMQDLRNSGGRIGQASYGDGGCGHRLGPERRTTSLTKLFKSAFD
jgi:hypothetical protein